jgi:hypothetical protein
MKNILKMRQNSNLRHKTTAYLLHFKNIFYVYVPRRINTYQAIVYNFRLLSGKAVAEILNIFHWVLTS